MCYINIGFYGAKAYKNIRSDNKNILDTTIPNYVYAHHLPEKQDLTIKLFGEIRKGIHQAYISDVVLGELKRAEEPLRARLIKEVEGLDILPVTIEIETCASAYVENKIISQNYMDDARHVAIATINNLNAVISWNYDHLVSLSKVIRINEINKKLGYRHIEITTPREVVKL